MIRDQIALAYSDSGEWTAAIEEQTEAVLRFPRFAVAHKALAHALQSSGRIEDAVAEFREAVRLAPRFSSAYLFLGRALIETGDFRERSKPWPASTQVRRQRTPSLAQSRSGLAPGSC